MAYCDKCGAYLPDGQEKCLACGYDPAEEQKNSAYAYRQQESQRAEAEQRRRERQEADRKWAESEQHRRNIEEEFKRRQKEAEERAQSFINREFKSSDSEGEGFGSFRMYEVQNKGLAAISYLGILFLIPMFLAQNDEYAKFHAKQGARLFICTAIANALGAIFHVGWIVNILAFLLTISGIKNAVKGKMEPLPYIGKMKMF